MPPSLTDVTSSVTFNVFFNPPHEMRSGFAEVMTVEFSDYGPPQREDDSQFNLSIRCKGRNKTASGKPDMRTRDRGLIIGRREEEMKMLIDALKGTTDIRLMQIRAFAIQEIEDNQERWNER